MTPRRGTQARAMLREVFLWRWWLKSAMWHGETVESMACKSSTIVVAAALHAARDYQKREWERKNPAVAQSVERGPYKAEASGSSPDGGTFPGVDPVKAAEWWSRVE